MRPPGVYSFQDGHIELIEKAMRAHAGDPVAAAVTLAREGWAYQLAEARADEERYGGATPGTTGTRWARSPG